MNSSAPSSPLPKDADADAALVAALASRVRWDPARPNLLSVSLPGGGGGAEARVTRRQQAWRPPGADNAGAAAAAAAGPIVPTLGAASARPLALSDPAAPRGRLETSELSRVVLQAGLAAPSEDGDPEALEGEGRAGTSPPLSAQRISASQVVTKWAWRSEADVLPSELAGRSDSGTGVGGPALIVASQVVAQFSSSLSLAGGRPDCTYTYGLALRRG